MATLPDLPPGAAVRAAAELLAQACTGAAAILFDHDHPTPRRSRGRPRKQRS